MYNEIVVPLMPHNQDGRQGCNHNRGAGLGCSNCSISVAERTKIILQQGVLPSFFY